MMKSGTGFCFNSILNLKLLLEVIHFFRLFSLLLTMDGMACQILEQGFGVDFSLEFPVDLDFWLLTDHQAAG